LAEGLRWRLFTKPLAPASRNPCRNAARRAETAIATGCDEFDAKPIEFESLIATIRRVLANPK
jgi:hypothetical protein